jgi:hypothetical protein
MYRRLPARQSGLVLPRINVLLSEAGRHDRLYAKTRRRRLALLDAGGGHPA